MKRPCWAQPQAYCHTQRSEKKDYAGKTPEGEVTPRELLTGKKALWSVSREKKRTNNEGRKSVRHPSSETGANRLRGSRGNEGSQGTSFPDQN